MKLFALGINHRTAPLALREHYAFDQARAHAALQQLRRQPHIEEAALIATCNRTELYCYAHPEAATAHWFQQLAEIHVTSPYNSLSSGESNALSSSTAIDSITTPEQSTATPMTFLSTAAEYSAAPSSSLNGLDATSSSNLLANSLYHYEDTAAIRHLIRVTTGLDSMILGETPIANQVKQGFEWAKQAGTLGRTLSRLFPAVFAASKSIRTHAAMNQAPLSQAYITLQLIKQLFTPLSACRVLLIGAGELNQRIAIYLRDHGIQTLWIANRSHESARALAQQTGGSAISLSDIINYLPKADVVIAATRSPSTLIDLTQMKTGLAQRKRRPILMLDLGMPRNLDSAISTLNDVYLYNLDDLQSIIKQNLQHRRAAAEQAEAIIDLAVQDIVQQLNCTHAGQLIQEYRSQLTQIRDDYLQRAHQQLRRGQSPHAVLDRFAHQLTNRVLHHTTVKIREAASDNNQAVLALIRHLFDLEIQ